MILAPLRGVTIRCFRETFAEVIAAAGFTEAITPFIPAMAGVDPLKDRELSPHLPPLTSDLSPLPSDLSPLTSILLTPQFIGKDPAALRECLERVKGAGYRTADLNCGCPFPMVRNKGRGSGILKTPAVLEKMLAVGCEVMGEGNFSIKARLGVDRPDELLALMPMINSFPLRFLTVHGRIARQMYEGSCDTEMVNRVVAAAKVPVVLNGDLPFPPATSPSTSISTSTSTTPSTSTSFLHLMLGRSFIRALGERDDVGELLARYVDASKTELCGDRPVLGRLKELIAYWKDSPRWHRRWQVVKLARTVEELKAVAL